LITCDARDRTSVIDALSSLVSFTLGMRRDAGDPKVEVTT
jgi:hypothetical protein